jgi:hypothetical protein
MWLAARLNNDAIRFGLIAEEVAEVNPALVSARQGRKTLQRALRRGERHVSDEFVKEHRTVQDVKAKTYEPIPG